MERKLYVTLFAGCELRRATVARQILTSRKSKTAAGSAPLRQFFFTVFGGAEIKWPTLAEEFIDLREIVASGALSLDEYERAVVEFGSFEPSISSLTLFAGFSECELPSEEEEIDALALHRHVGTIPDSAGRVLQLGIGQRDAERRATVHRAVLATC